MKTKHTPGPWTIRTDYPYHNIVSNDGRLIAETMLGSQTDEDKANARLIAAAPDLLASCKALVAAFWGAFPEKLRLGCRKDYPDHPVCRAESAILKAEGKQP
ncbi:MAG TPA: hypothetical protein VFM25_03955 [Verrucomicrobiae bacterium]|nr:hypothetical protein [Verrucomicrobiae bacterium]